jgi:hypothetical protein
MINEKKKKQIKDKIKEKKSNLKHVKKKPDMSPPELAYQIRGLIMIPW